MLSLFRQFVLTGWICLATTPVLDAARAAASIPRPNTILIWTDDQGGGAFLNRGLGTNTVLYCRMIRNMDAPVGRPLDRLHAWNPDRQTLVILMTHNGHSVAETCNDRMHGVKGSPHRGAICQGRFKWVNNAELYDLVADPEESQNMANERPGIVKHLRNQYERWWREVLPATLENAAARCPTFDPFQEPYWQQWGSGPDGKLHQQMNPDIKFYPPAPKTNPL